MLHGWLLIVAVLIISSCTSLPAPSEPEEFESKLLIYDSLLLDFREPADSSPNVVNTSRGDGIREGTKYMLQAPVSCMQAGMLYGFCLVLAPAFPWLAANRIQDQAVSLAEVEALAMHIDALNFRQRFQSELKRRLEAAELPVVEIDKARTVRLQVELDHMRLEHTGYKNDAITVTQPYRFVLLEVTGRTANIVSGELTQRFYANEWPNETAEVDTAVTNWIDRLATKGVSDTLLEWRPRIVLAPRSPQPVATRSLIGFRQETWPFVESTRPRLEWQPLDELLEPEILDQVSAITYELQIAGYANSSEYFVTGLTEPRHDVTKHLIPCTNYRWRPRARFLYQGVVHITSLRTRPWSKTEQVDDHYLLKIPAPDCKNPTWRTE